MVAMATGSSESEVTTGAHWVAAGDTGQQSQARVRVTQTHHDIRASATGTRTRVARVRAEYPDQLDYSGWWQRLTAAAHPR